VIQVWAVEGIPEVVAGDDIAGLIIRAISTSSITGDRISTGSITEIEDGDIVVVTSKIVSKAEGRSVKAQDREDAITSQTVRVVATRGNTRIVENPLGLVLAAAGVDSSNTPEGTVLLLPEDPDASARAIRAALGKNIGVLITDTIGRPWRQGVTDIAIGAAGIQVLEDLRGTPDADGRPLEGTIVAIADEIASAVDLVTGKSKNLPVAIVRGLAHYVTVEDGPGAASMVRPPEEDMFRLGTTEAWDEGYRAGLQAGERD
jgi:coenzyme F420-0:L-glutamate ligase/coenzyme F420-1:gamma-L-glutamate ligase